MSEPRPYVIDGYAYEAMKARAEKAEAALRICETARDACEARALKAEAAEEALMEVLRAWDSLQDFPQTVAHIQQWMKVVDATILRVRAALSEKVPAP